jgi:glutaredoxin
MTLPRHPLESAGFASVGDTHSSRAMKAGEKDERATRFGGKTQECGLHTQTISLDMLMAQLDEVPTLPDGYVLFTKPTCKFCKAAKALLTEQGQAYIEKDITNEEVAAEMYNRVPDAKTVPQIFSDNQHIGGFTNLWAKLGIEGIAEDFARRFSKEMLELNSKHNSSFNISQMFGWGDKLDTNHRVAFVMGGAALLNVAAFLLGPSLAQGNPKCLESSSRLCSDSKLLDSAARLLVR